jgi:hypothetical protein
LLTRTFLFLFLCFSVSLFFSSFLLVFTFVSLSPTSQVKVIFLASTTCEGRYHSFGETNFLYLQDWRWRRQYISPKCWCLLTSPQDATPQKTDIDIYTAVTTLNVEYLNRPIWHILDTSRNFISAACILLTLFSFKPKEHFHMNMWQLPSLSKASTLFCSFTCSFNDLKLKLKQSHYTPWNAWGERRYSSYSFSTSALDGGEWSASRPCRALAPGKGPPVPIVQEAWWAPQPVWTQRLQEKSFRLCRGSNLDSPVVQPVARDYTDWATRL